MLKKIVLKSVASYKGAAKDGTVDFDDKKRRSYFYGLNGAGKSTISSFLFYQSLLGHGVGKGDVDFDRLAAKYKSCKCEIDDGDTLLVYNEDFIKRNFSEKGSQVEGIEAQITIGADNVASAEKINEANEKLKNYYQRRTDFITEEKNLEKIREKEFKEGPKVIIEQYIKSDMSSKGLYNFMTGYKQVTNIWKKLVETTISEVDIDLDSIKEKVDAMDGNSDPITPVSKTPNAFSEIEQNPIWKKEIVNREPDNEYSDSPIYPRWLTEGLEMIIGKDEDCNCPFCGQKKEKLAEFIKSQIGDNYEKDMTEIKNKHLLYRASYDSIYDEVPSIISSQKCEDFSKAVSDLKKALKDNLNLMKEKEMFSGNPIELKNTKELYYVYSQLVDEINEEIEKHNLALKDQKNYIEVLKEEFWKYQRKKFDMEITLYQKNEEERARRNDEIDQELDNLKSDIEEQKTIISEWKNKKYQVGYEHINSMLKQVGITGFYLASVDEDPGTYKIVRPDSENSDDVYKTLSEGEKMMVSFLYFIELCEGVEDKSKLVAVFDDPMSSMSNRFLYNVVTFIKKIFVIPYYNLKKSYTKAPHLIVLTHNLVFFNELVDYNRKRSESDEMLFRIVKKDDISSIHQMEYDEIQSDYQALWSELKNEDTNPIIIANCMRSIIERFYTFSEKISIGAVFDKDEVRNDNEFEALEKFLNARSHANEKFAVDINEFDYAQYLDSFKLLFERTGYAGHFNAMMDIK